MAKADTSTNTGSTNTSNGMGDKSAAEIASQERGIADAVAKAVESADEQGDDAFAIKKSVADKAATAKPAAEKGKKPAVRKSTPRKTVAHKTGASETAPATTSARSVATTGLTSSSKSKHDNKENLMVTANKTDTNHTAAATATAADMNDRMQGAFAKTTEFASEAGDFGTKNMEAMVESGKLFFDGAQDLMREQMEDGKNAVETMTQDAKAMASAKTPTEFMQLQSELARRNFDTMISYGSKRTEAWVKLYNEAFAPISNRVSVAAEKMNTAA